LKEKKNRMGQFGDRSKLVVRASIVPEARALEKEEKTSVETSIVPEARVTRESLIDSIFEVEKGYSDNVEDTGNYYNDKLIGTNFGITAATLAEHLGREPTVDEMKNLSEETAREITSKKYYDRFKVGTLPASLQEIFFHAAFLGESRAVRSLQNLLNLEPDGVLGSKTKSKMKESSFTKKEFKDAFLKELEFGTKGFSEPSDSWKDFGKGWSKRFEELAK
jgi:lysozyme family protein